MTDALEVRVGQLFTEQKLTIGLAESCTGGLIANRLTNVPGASIYLLGSAVTYANSAKENVLGVTSETLDAEGAVSAETAREMARGARKLFGADVAVAVTGIAGPDGGTPEKPVGLTFLHLSATDAEWGERHVWHGNRLENKQRTADAALALLLRYAEQRQNHKPAETTHTEIIKRTNSPFHRVHVDAWHVSESEIHPRAFDWRGSTEIVASEGRRWTETVDGVTWACFLVQTSLGDTFELRHDLHKNAWFISGVWLRPRVT